ncbi:MAG: hypothetical protein KF901_22915 [Myxococcales bacterium]|nr:hypothetical protein [Myxococcales bacterium]
MNLRFVAIVAVLLVFTAYTLDRVFAHGLLGWLAPEALEGWGLQVVLDLGLALVGFITLAIPDAKRRGITYWPYLVVAATCGSIGVLAYLARRELGQDHAARKAAPT